VFAEVGSQDFAAARDRLAAGIAALADAYEEAGIGPGPRVPLAEPVAATAAGLLAETERLLARERVLSLYLAGRLWAGGADRQTSETLAALTEATSGLGRLLVLLESWIARSEPADLGLSDGYAAWIQAARRRASHALPVGEERLAATLTATGSAAWRRLHEQLVAELHGELDGVRVPITVLRSHATAPLAELRHRAHLAELDAWRSLEMPAAACLNAIKGEGLALAERRGQPDVLSATLEAEGLRNEDLDALHAGVREAAPALRRFLRHKAALLGHDGPMPWWDIAAPLPGDKQVTWQQAVDVVVTAFSAFSPALAAHATLMADRGWIDAQIRPGKRLTASCLPLQGGASRILLCFDGTVDSVMTLAHELGHAYHYLRQGDLPELQRATPLALSEYPSMLCEGLVVEAVLAGHVPGRRDAFLNAALIGATQVVLDTYSRFLFERELFRRRRAGPLSPAAITALLRAAQEEVFGDAVDPGSLHTRRWVAQPHFYGPPFRNWPYYLGLMLARAARPDPATVDWVLTESGRRSLPSLLATLGVRLDDREPWSRAAGAINDQVTLFAGLQGGSP